MATNEDFTDVYRAILDTYTNAYGAAYKPSYKPASGHRGAQRRDTQHRHTSTTTPPESNGDSIVNTVVWCIMAVLLVMLLFGAMESFRQRPVQRDPTPEPASEPAPPSPPREPEPLVTIGGPYIPPPNDGIPFRLPDPNPPPPPPPPTLEHYAQEGLPRPSSVWGRLYQRFHDDVLHSDTRYRIQNEFIEPYIYPLMQWKVLIPLAIVGPMAFVVASIAVTETKAIASDVVFRYHQSVNNVRRYFPSRSLGTSSSKADTSASSVEPSSSPSWPTSSDCNSCSYPHTDLSSVTTSDLDATTLLEPYTEASSQTTEQTTPETTSAIEEFDKSSTSSPSPDKEQTSSTLSEKWTEFWTYTGGFSAQIAEDAWGRDSHSSWRTRPTGQTNRYTRTSRTGRATRKPRKTLEGSYSVSTPEPQPEVERYTRHEGWLYCPTCRQRHCCEFSDRTLDTNTHPHTL